MRTINPALLSTTATVRRVTHVPDDMGGSTEAWRTVGQLRCRISDPQLVQRTDQQGRLGVDLARTLYAMPGANLRTGDQVSAGTLRATVESAGNAPDAPYFKALLVEDAPG